MPRFTARSGLDLTDTLKAAGMPAAFSSAVDAQIVSAGQPHTVTVDRPFLFVITDTATGAPLFLGRIADPTDQGKP